MKKLMILTMLALNGVSIVAGSMAKPAIGKQGQKSKSQKDALTDSKEQAIARMRQAANEAANEADRADIQKELLRMGAAALADDEENTPKKAAKAAEHQKLADKAMAKREKEITTRTIADSYSNAVAILANLKDARGKAVNLARLAANEKAMTDLDKDSLKALRAQAKQLASLDLESLAQLVDKLVFHDKKALALMGLKPNRPLSRSEVNAKLASALAADSRAILETTYGNEALQAMNAEDGDLVAGDESENDVVGGAKAEDVVGGTESEVEAFALQRLKDAAAAKGDKKALMPIARATFEALQAADQLKEYVLAPEAPANVDEVGKAPRKAKAHAKKSNKTVKVQKHKAVKVGKKKDSKKDEVRTQSMNRTKLAEDIQKLEGVEVEMVRDINAPRYNPGKQPKTQKHEHKKTTQHYRNS